MSDRARAWLLPIALCGLAISVRLGYLYDIRGIAFFTQPVSDGLVYDQRARGIAAGDWLGPADFVHAPLYAYVLGLTKLVAGESPWAPRVLQTIGSAGACLLVASTARRLFGRGAGALAGLWLALYAPAIFFDGLIQKASLTLLLSAAVLYLVVWAGDRASSASRPLTVNWALAGVALGLLILNRQNALIFLPLVLGWLWWGPAGSTSHRNPHSSILTPRRFRWTAVFLVATAATLLPWVVRNRAVTGEWVLTTPNLGQNFAMGNHPRATGTYVPLKRGRASGVSEQAEWTRAAQRATGRQLTAREVSDYYLHTGLAWVREHPGDWLKLTLRKVLLTWNAGELMDTEDYYLYQRSSPLLRLLEYGLNFGTLAPAAALGAVLTATRWRQLWLLYGWLALTTLSVAAFVVFARYRLPLVPPLAILAAAGLVEAARRLLARQFRGLAMPLLVCLVVACTANYPMVPRSPSPAAYTNYAVALADLGRYQEAFAELDRALDLRPDDADAHAVYGSVLAEIGQPAKAAAHYQRAAAADPWFGAAYRGVGDALAAQGQLDAAVEEYLRALEIEPDDYITLSCLAAARARQNRPAEAIDLLTRALRLAPDYPEAHLNLGNTYLMLGDAERAAAEYEKALKLRPAYADAWHNLGLLSRQRGDTRRALGQLEAAFQAAPARADIRDDLLALLLEQREYDRALAVLDRCLQRTPNDSRLVQARKAIESLRGRH